jgi:hypothetical protein
MLTMSATGADVSGAGPARFRRLAGIVAVVVAASGCALDDSGSVAVRRPVDAPAGLEIVFGHCAAGSDVRIGTDRLTDIDVRVESVPGEPTTTTTAELDPADEPASPSFGRTQFDRIIWSVHADEPRRLDSVRVGSTPRGFATVIPLDVPLPERLLIVARSAGDSSSDGVAELSVILGNVPADGTFVLDENGTTTLDEFLDRVRTEECGLASTDAGRSSLGSTLTSLLVRLAILSGSLLAVIAAVLVWRRRREEDLDESDEGLDADSDAAADETAVPPLSMGDVPPPIDDAPVVRSDDFP